MSDWWDWDKFFDYFKWWYDEIADIVGDTCAFWLIVFFLGGLINDAVKKLNEEKKLRREKPD